MKFPRLVTMDTDRWPYRLQPTNAGAISAPYVAFALHAPDGESTLTVPWRRAMEVAAWLRHASAGALRTSHLAGRVDSFVLGHSAKGEPTGEHLSFVPLPSIGSQQADGQIRRVMIVESAASDGAAIDLLGAHLAGVEVTDDTLAPACILSPLADRKVMPFYTARARLWRSVTPVILHGHNSMRGRISLAKTHNLLARAFAMAGHDPAGIDSMTFQPAPLWPNTGAAASMRVPNHLNNYPRYHVEVRFQSPVQGPVLAGIGRHYGIGAFASPGDRA